MTVHMKSGAGRCLQILAVAGMLVLCVCGAWISIEGITQAAYTAAQRSADTMVSRPLLRSPFEAIRT